MGVRGRLTKEQFAFTMPVDAPLYQRPPFYYKDAQLALFEYETEAAPRRAFCPRPSNCQTRQPPPWPWSNIPGRPSARTTKLSCL
jgi:hypothetical protein